MVTVAAICRPVLTPTDVGKPLCSAIETTFGGVGVEPDPPHASRVERVAITMDNRAGFLGVMADFLAAYFLAGGGTSRIRKHRRRFNGVASVIRGIGK